MWRLLSRLICRWWNSSACCFPIWWKLSHFSRPVIFTLWLPEKSPLPALRQCTGTTSAVLQRLHVPWRLWLKRISLTARPEKSLSKILFLSTGCGTTTTNFRRVFTFLSDKIAPPHFVYQLENPPSLIVLWWWRKTLLGGVNLIHPHHSAPPPPNRADNWSASPALL